ncbi:hypothetical protein MGN70_004867 [Eutypa lata]|nr:hypothetical protein MGN70_004867 [Eutypa lata]
MSKDSEPIGGSSSGRIQACEAQRRTAIYARKCREVSPSWNRRENNAEPPRRSPGSDGLYAVPPPLRIPPNVHDFCVGVQFHHYKHEVGRWQVCSHHEAGGCFLD